MTDSAQSFRDFEQRGWEDSNVCSSYHEHLSTVTRQCVDAVLDAAGVAKGMQVLDVATGAGYVAAAAAERGATATGVDFSSTQVQLAKGRYPALRFEQADAEQLPFEAESFDAVVCNYGTCHFPDPQAALRDAFRVLKRGGRVAFAVWDTPENAIGFGVVYGAIRAHGSMNVGLPVGPNFFLYSDPEQAKNALFNAGFKLPDVRRVRQVWRVRTPEQLFDVMMHATVRASATLRAQTPAARQAIEAAVNDTVRKYRVGEIYEIPMPAMVSSAVKP